MIQAEAHGSDKPASANRAYQAFAKKFLLPIIAVAVAWPCFTSVKDAAERAQWFHITGDEALHAEIIENLAQTGSYQDWRGSRFVPHLTTGPTLIVPAALLQRTFHIRGAVAGRVISFAYFLGFLALILTLLSFFTGKSRIAPGDRAMILLFGLGAFFWHWRTLQDDLYYAFAILGEGPAAFFMVLAIWASLRQRVFWTGLAAGLSALSKPYLALLPVILLIDSVFSMGRVRWPGRQERRNFGKLFAGIALPWGLWILWMALSLGPLQSFLFWKNYPAIMRATNGGGLATGAGLSLGFFLHQIVDKVHALPTILKARGLVLASLGIVSSLWLYPRQKEWKPWCAFSWIHLLWWFFLSPGVQARYLMPAFLILSILNLKAGFLIVQRQNFWQRQKLWRLPRTSPAMIAFLGAFVIMKFSLSIGSSWQRNWNNMESCGFCRQLKAQEYWLRLPQRPTLYSTSTSYVRDLDLVLTAPHELEPLPAPTELVSPGWITVGEFAKQGTLEQLKNRHCHPVFELDLSQDGFWECRQ